jgi:hypothetical protein
MDIAILATVILAGILLESLIAERARKRDEQEDTRTDRLVEQKGRTRE